eukprot:scaffold62063_cov65-Phaeocystis_antarctica.AAC.7
MCKPTSVLERRWHPPLEWEWAALCFRADCRKSGAWAGATVTLSKAPSPPRSRRGGGSVPSDSG